MDRNMTHYPKTKSKELVVNFHLTQACNFSCHYCFAKWNQSAKEIIHSAKQVALLLDEITKLHEYLTQQTGYEFSQTRLNLVGGETFLYQRKVLSMIEQAKIRGLKLSAITNGSRLNNDLISSIGGSLDSIGFSVDSRANDTNLRIGRSVNGKPMDLDKLIGDIGQIRLLNPNIDIKINTVVSSLNKEEYMGQIIEQIRPNKWKIFKVLNSVTSDYNVTQHEFESFILKHQVFNDIMFTEDNDEMTDSYIMIDPLGRFFQNSNCTNGAYTYSPSIIEHGIERAFDSINFDIERFFNRYKLKYIPTFQVEPA